jgi:hypothetical protein
MEMVHDRCSTLLIEFGTALTTILPILFQYCYKYYYSEERSLKFRVSCILFPLINVKALNIDYICIAV